MARMSPSSMAKLVGRVERSETRHSPPSIVAEHKNLHRGLDLKQQATIATGQISSCLFLLQCTFYKNVGFRDFALPDLPGFTIEINLE